MLLSSSFQKILSGTLSTSKCLNPDQDCHSVSPDLDPKLLAEVISRQQKPQLAKKALIKFHYPRFGSNREIVDKKSLTLLQKRKNTIYPSYAPYTGGITNVSQNFPNLELL